MQNRSKTFGIPLLIAIAVLIPLLMVEHQDSAIAVSESEEMLSVEFSSQSGYYDDHMALVMHTSDPEATIYFTTDGGIPDSTSSIYTKPLYFSATENDLLVIRARTCLSNKVSNFNCQPTGLITTATYLFGKNSSLPIISLAVDPDDLWNSETGIFEHPHERGSEWEKPVHITYFDIHNQRISELGAGLRIHGVGSRSYDKKSMRLYVREGYGVSWWEYPLFSDSEVNRFKRLVLHAGGQDMPAHKANATLIRNHLVTGLAPSVDVFTASLKPVLLYINGQSWGVYNLRERMDSRFWSTHMDVAPAAGELTNWERLVNFIENNPVSDPDNYAYVATQIDIGNFIDYNIVQMYTANIDWPNFNQTRVRLDIPGSRWHWLFWDSDYAFGLEPGNVEYNSVEWVFENDDDRLVAGALLLRSLMTNPEFSERFFNRATELLNWELSPNTVLKTAKSVIGELEPGMEYESVRWPGSGVWNHNADAILDFVAQRSDIFLQHLSDGFELDGVVTVNIGESGSGQGSIAVNGREIEKLPWQGRFFKDQELLLVAIPAPGYEFDSWSGGLGPDPVIKVPVSAMTEQAITPSFRIQNNGSVQEGDVTITNAGGTGYQLNNQAESPFEGDWIELQVLKFGGVDLRDWRITDNDAVGITDEGSLILPSIPELSNVPAGTSILIVASWTPTNSSLMPEDDIYLGDGNIMLYVGNGLLNVSRDPWFRIGQIDNLALLAPGASGSFEDDSLIDYVILGETPYPNRQVTRAEFLSATWTD